MYGVDADPIDDDVGTNTPHLYTGPTGEGPTPSRSPRPGQTTTTTTTSKRASEQQPSLPSPAELAPPSISPLPKSTRGEGTLLDGMMLRRTPDLFGRGGSQLALHDAMLAMLTLPSSTCAAWAGNFSPVPEYSALRTYLPPRQLGRPLGESLCRRPPCIERRAVQTP